MSCVPLSYWRILENHWHQRLTDGALPSLGHFTPNATVGHYLARGGGCLGEALGVAGGQGGEGVGVLPYKVAHIACDELEAVGCARRGEGVSRSHLENFRQGNLLQEGQRAIDDKQVQETQNCWWTNI